MPDGSTASSCAETQSDGNGLEFLATLTARHIADATKLLRFDRRPLNLNPRCASIRSRTEPNLTRLCVGKKDATLVSELRLIAPRLVSRHIPPIEKSHYDGSDENQFQDGAQTDLVKAGHRHSAKVCP